MNSIALRLGAMLRHGFVAGVVLLFIGCYASVEGALLGVHGHAPDISSHSVQVVYDGVTDSFKAKGKATSFDIDGTAPPDYTLATTSKFYIDITVDSSGIASPTPGVDSLRVVGTIPAPAPYTTSSGILLTGSLDSFGYSDPSDPGQFDFLFKVTGGDLKDYFGTKVGVTMAGLGFLGSFAGNFTTSARGTADIFAPVPELNSAAVWSVLGCLGAFAMLLRRRCSMPFSYR